MITGLIELTRRNKISIQNENPNDAFVFKYIT